MADFDYIKNWTTEDDYVERGGSCEELTVTITLREYRGLIEEKVKQAAEIERLTAECDKFEKQAQEYAKALFAKCPDVMRNITQAVREILGTDSDEDNEAAECEHEFVYDELQGQYVCEKCGYVLTADEKRAALEHANALRRAEEANPT